ncbi:MAG: FtsX-like permease family protein [Bacteroidales bacterium]|nr:FtsX-like permease family protein [Bacteroidales bacterium]
MNHRSIISQSRKFYWRFYRLVALAVIVMMAVLTGSLLLGDSVRGTLVKRVGERLGSTETIIVGGTGFMSETVMQQPLLAHAQGFLMSDGFVSLGDKLLPVYVWGTDADSLQWGEAMVNEPLLDKLGDIDEIVLHLPAHSLVPSGSLFVTKRYATQLRLHVEGVKGVDKGGNLLLKNEQTLPLNVFVCREELAEAMELEGRINVILADDVIDEKQWADSWTPECSGFSSTDTSLVYDGIFIPREMVDKLCDNAERTTRYFSYLVNDLATSRDTIPYSFVTAVEKWQGEPLTGRDVILSDYAARRLHVAEGDSVSMSYFVARDLKALDTSEQRLSVKRIVPLADFRADSLLMAEFPGLSQVERCTDWDSDLPIRMERVTKVDEDYWYAYRQTPKAIVSYEAVSADWSNAFGSATALRFAEPSSFDITPGDAGVLLYHPRAQALRAASGGVDFAGLFLALGFFIILAAILLMNNPLVEMFTLRVGEMQLYRQMGFSEKSIRNQWFREAFSIVLLSSPIGVIAGLLYSSLTLWLLGNVWSGATHTEGFALHIQPLTLVIGWLAGLLICMLSLWFVFRHLLREGKTEQSEGINRRHGSWLLALGFLLITLVLTVMNFVSFRSMALFIVCGLLWLITWSLFLRALVNRRAESQAPTRGQLLWQTLQNRLRQHLLVYWTLALGVFTVFAVGLNRPDFSQAIRDAGGYQYYVESCVPIQYDLNNPSARRQLSLQSLPDSTTFLPFLRHTQDEASCLNLNKVSTPTVLGIDLTNMRPFGLDPAPSSPPSLYIDQEALIWSLMKSVGDTIFYQDGRGETVPVIIAGTYPTGLFHGCAIMSSDDFRRLWPKETGIEVFLMKSSRPAEAAELLSTAMNEYGLLIQTVTERLQMFFEVTETYLIIFLTLGGLGLLLGIFSLIIIVRKNLTAQRPTIDQFRALGFTDTLIRHLMLRENLFVPLYAILAGATGAVISISANVGGAGAFTLLLALLGLLALCLLLFFGIKYIIHRHL